MDLLLRFHGGFGVDSGPDSYGQETIITVPQDVAEKSGRFETDFVVNVKVPLGSMNRFLHPTCDENGNPLGDCHFDGTCDEDGNLIVDWLFVGNPLRGWYFDVDSALAEWAKANYPLNWELGVTNCQLNYPLNWELGLASDLTDVELAEQARLDELYDARLAELELYEEARLAEMQLELAVKDHLLEMQLAEAKWSDPDGYELAEAAYLAELAEKVRLDALAEEAYWADGANYPLNYPLNWELYEEARLAKLYDARVAALAEEDQLVEMQLADWEAPTNSELYEDDHLADMHEEVRLDALDEEAHVVDSALHEASRMTEWKEEIRLANWCKEGYPLRWD